MSVKGQKDIPKDSFMKNSIEKTDIVLVNPPNTVGRNFGVFSSAGALRPPLNLLNLAASLLDGGYSVKILDGPAIAGGAEEVVNHVCMLSPRFVGITSMTGLIHTASEIACSIKERLAGTTIILGGIHVSTLPIDTMRQYPGFDVGVVGEGERTLTELLEALDSKSDLSNVPGLVIHTEQGPVLTETRELIKNIDTLPLPAWDLVPNYVETYQPTMSRRTRLPSAYIVTSRGCPFGCTFCSNVVHGRTFRSYSIDYIMRMIHHLIDAYQIRDLTIYDENLAFNRKRIVEFCNRLIEDNHDLTWSCDARADSVDNETLALMYKAGCRKIWYGMESGNETILRRYNKGVSLDDLERAAKLSRANNIEVSGSFIIGGPCETPETIRDTIKFAKKIKLDYFIPFFYTPVPGTPDYPDITEYGTANLDFKDVTMAKVTFAPNGMTFRDIERWHLKALLSFYLKPRAIIRMIRDAGFLGFIGMGLSMLTNLVSHIFWKK